MPTRLTRVIQARSGHRAECRPPCPTCGRSRRLLRTGQRFQFLGAAAFTDWSRRVPFRFGTTMRCPTCQAALTLDEYRRIRR